MDECLAAGMNRMGGWKNKSSANSASSAREKGFNGVKKVSIRRSQGRRSLFSGEANLLLCYYNK